MFSDTYTHSVTSGQQKNKHTRRAHFPHTLPSLGVVSSATISAPADTISLSAHILIVFSNTIRKSTLTFLISIHLLQKKRKNLQNLLKIFNIIGVIYSNVQDFLYTNDTDDSHLLQFPRDESSQDYGAC